MSKGQGQKQKNINTEDAFKRKEQKCLGEVNDVSCYRDIKQKKKLKIFHWICDKDIMGVLGRTI